MAALQFACSQPVFRGQPLSGAVSHRVSSWHHVIMSMPHKTIRSVALWQSLATLCLVTTLQLWRSSLRHAGDCLPWIITKGAGRIATDNERLGSFVPCNVQTPLVGKAAKRGVICEVSTSRLSMERFGGRVPRESSKPVISIKQTTACRILPLSKNLNFFT